MLKQTLADFYSKYKVIIYPFVVGVASLSLIILVILPQIRGYFNSKEDEKLMQNRLKSLEIKAEELEAIPEESLRRRVLSATVALPSEKDYTSIIGLLQRLTAEAGVNLESVTLDSGGVKETTGASSFGVKIDVSAGSSSFDEFLKKIESSPAVLKIGSLTTDASVENVISGSLVIDVFYSPAPKALGSVDSPLPKLTEEEEVLAQELVSSIAIAPAVSTTTSEQPAKLPPRGKANPFE